MVARQTALLNDELDKTTIFQHMKYLDLSGSQLWDSKTRTLDPIHLAVLVRGRMEVSAARTTPTAHR